MARYIIKIDVPGTLPIEAWDEIRKTLQQIVEKYLKMRVSIEITPARSRSEEEWFPFRF